MKVRNLEKSVNGFKLGPVNFEVEGGYVTGIIGRNGSGKSTLLGCILGTGTYEGSIEGTVPREEMAYILDEPVFPATYSAKHIAMCYGSMYKGFDKEYFFDICRKNNIPANKPINKLSKGMSIMLQYAFASSYPAKLLILDEPTAHLDEWAKKELYTFVSDFTDREGIVLWASHIYGEIDKMADYVVGLKDGREVFFEEKEKLTDRYIKVSGSSEQLDYMKRGIVGRRDGAMGSTGLLDNEAGVAIMFGKRERADIEDIVEFLL